MRYPIVAASLLAGVLSVFVSWRSSGAGDEPAKRAPDEPQPAKPKGKPQTYTDGQFVGKVTKIGTDGFEVGAGWKGWLVPNKGNEGNDKAVWIITTNTIVGGDPNGLGNWPDDTYKLGELKIGDIVIVETEVTRAGEQYGTQVWIKRRPGGRIPPLPADKFGTPNYISAMYQAEQDWEEKRIPIPKQFLEKGEYPWTNPPYPLPTAPMPRLVEKPKG